MNPKILFLYTEIAEYFLAGIEALNKKEVETHIVKWATNKEAPFNFRSLKNVHFYERNNYSNAELSLLVKNINPNIIIVSGWIDKGYLKSLKPFQNKIPIVLSLDNHWTGSLKQRVAALVSPVFLKNKFSHAWVPGEAQKQYALKLGFKENKIHQGFYSADTQLFSKYYQKYLTQKQQNYPKKLLYVGRYIKEKAILLLWEAFIELQAEQPNNWELICVGTGELFDQRKTHPKIKHLGFIQPAKMHTITDETGVCVLPSNFEPWGVVVHEYAAVGFPLICSEKIGAATSFLEEGKNGFFFQSGNKEELKRALKKIMSASSDQLFEMGELSHKKSQQLSPETWANTVLEILKPKKTAGCNICSPV